MPDLNKDFPQFPHSDYEPNVSWRYLETQLDGWIRKYDLDVNRPRP